VDDFTGLPVVINEFAKAGHDIQDATDLAELLEHPSLADVRKLWL
jgi:hypothetical protein